MIFRFCNCIFIFQHSIAFLFNVGNKIFCFLKKWVFPFLDEGTVQGGAGGGGGELSYTLIPWRTLWTYLIKDLTEVLTRFMPLTSGFLMFSEDIKRDKWHEIDYSHENIFVCFCGSLGLWGKWCSKPSTCQCNALIILMLNNWIQFIYCKMLTFT